MTTYTYHCGKCDRTIEHDFPMGKASTTVRCPRCNGKSRRDFRVNVIIPDQHKATPAKNPQLSEEKPKPKRRTRKKKKE